MKKVLLVVVSLVLAAAMLATATIPNPVTHEPEELTMEEVHQRYLSYVTLETEGSVWGSSSKAVFLTPEYLIHNADYHAERNFFTEEERLKYREENLAMTKQRWIIAVSLYSDNYPYRDYINSKSSFTEITDILLINDKGKKVKVEVKVIDEVKRLADGYYFCLNTFAFPKKTSDSEEIIDENTKWIRVWIITPVERACFEYVFE